MKTRKVLRRAERVSSRESKTSDKDKDNKHGEQ
jgi:hypothetical protein